MKQINFSNLCDEGTADDFAGAVLFFRKAYADLVAAIASVKGAEAASERANAVVMSRRLQLQSALCMIESAHEKLLQNLKNVIPELSALCQGTPRPSIRELCVDVDNRERNLLNAAEAAGILRYNGEAKRYDAGSGISHQLVAYFAGRLLCGDYSKKERRDQGVPAVDTFVCGGRLPATKAAKLFGFDVSAARKQIKYQEIPPMGFKRVDELFPSRFEGAQ